MFFLLIWGRQTRSRRLGFVGPYTCPTCGWMGTFWLQAWDRRMRLYFVPVSKWRTRQYGCVCRHCGTTRYLTPEEGQRLEADMRPLSAPDPFGPAPPGTAAAVAATTDPPEAAADAWAAFAHGDD